MMIFYRKSKKETDEEVGMRANEEHCNNQSTSSQMVASCTNEKDRPAGKAFHWNHEASGRLYATRGGSTLGQGACCPMPPRFTCCPPTHIQKLVDRSDVISEVPTPRTPLEELTALP